MDDEKKRKQLSLRDKRKICKDFSQANLSKKDYIEQKGLPYHHLRRALEIQDQVINLDSADSSLDSIRLNTSVERKTSECDSFILDNIKTLRQKGLLIDKNTIISLATKFYKDRNINMRISSHFFRSFKKRNNVVYKKIFGESKSTDLSNFENFFNEFNVLRSSYNDEDIFNLDETSIFIKGGNTGSYILGGDDRKGIKKDKSRFTIGLCFSMKGEEICPFLIGKSSKPRIFKNYNFEIFNIHYFSNDSAWLTQTIFKKYLTKVNDELVKKNRKILLLLDNFSGHKINDFSNIKLLMFPPNTTAQLQPLDLGIINTFKQKYKKYLTFFINNLILEQRLDVKKSFKEVTLYKVFAWIRYSFDDISHLTIINCFNKFLSMDPRNKEIFITEESDKNKESEEKEENNSEYCDLEDICNLENEKTSIYDMKFYFEKLEEGLSKDKDLLKKLYELRIDYYTSISPKTSTKISKKA